jgi:hypothetical protein
VIRRAFQPERGIVLLETRFVSDTQLTVVIPAALLARPMSVQVMVATINYLDWYDGYNAGPRSDPVTFTVAPPR